MRLLNPGGGSQQANRTVADISERDALAASLTEGAVVTVLDASADPTVDSGPASYVWDGSQFIKLAETEGLDGTVTWTDVDGRPASPVVDIDDAVTKRHEHGQPLADIDDAAVKRHEHGQPLAFIDDAAVKRHAHGSSLADIDDAVTKRHEHGQPLADIDEAATMRHTHQDPDSAIHDAVLKAHEHGQPLADIDDAALKRHEHGQPLADIDDAALKRHEHANKDVLDLFGKQQWGHWPNYQGEALVRLAEEGKAIIVAPDAASRQAGDWPTTGWAGVVEAVHEMFKWVSYGDTLRVYLRPGTYNATSALAIHHPTGVRLQVYALTQPSLPATTDYGYTDAAADQQVLRDAYPVRLVYSSWACFYVYDGSGLTLSGLLFEAATPNSGTAIRATRNASVIAYRCSGIACASFIYADFGATVNFTSGGHFIGDGTNGTFAGVNYSASIYLRQGADANGTIVVAHAKIALSASTGANATMHLGSNPEKITIRKMSSNVISVLNGANVYCVGLDVRTSYRLAYTDRGNCQLHDIVDRTDKQIVYAVNCSRNRFSNIDLGPNTTSSQSRTFYAHSNSVNWCLESTFTGGTAVYNPALGNVGNKGAYNL